MVNRREFFGITVGAGATLALTPELLHALQQSGGKLIQRAIPSSGEMLPVIGPEGVLRYAGAIDDTPSSNVKDIARATNYVRAALDAGLAGNSAVAQTQPYGCDVKY